MTSLAKTLAPENLLIDQVLMTAIGLGLAALLWLPHAATAAQAKPANTTKPAAMASLDQPADQSQSMGGFEVAAPPSGPSSAYSFKPLSKGEKAVYEPINIKLNARYFTSDDVITLASHDIWPNQSWTLVNYMPWPPSVASVLAMKPLPVIRQHDETAKAAPVPVAAVPAKPASANGGPQGNDPVQHQQAASAPPPTAPVVAVAPAAIAPPALVIAAPAK